MFTGLVEEKGALVARASAGEGARLTIRSAMKELVLGESISVDGVCLTVVRDTGTGFEVDASSETLAKTTLGSVSIGGAVNLERALKMGAPLGGHIVTGHVDGRAVVESRREIGNAIELTFRLPEELARFAAAKGSIAVNGVSLTVNHVQGARFDVMIIPHTRGATTIDALIVGDRVNIEVDVLARYVARLLEVGRAGEPNDAGMMERLQRAGYV